MNSLSLSDSISGQYSIWIHEEEIAVITAYKDQWKLQTKQNYVIHQNLQEIVIEKDTIYSISCKQKPNILLFVKDQIHPVSYQKFKLKETMTIGRSPSCTIVYQKPYISGCHAILQYEQGTFLLEDNHSTNHVYVNKKRFTYGTLQLGDVIEIMDVQIIIGKGFLVIGNTQAITIHEENMEPYMAASKLILPKTIPYLPTFYHQSLHTPLEIHIKDFKEEAAVDETPLLLKLGPSFMMGLVSLSNILLVLQNRNSSHASFNFPMLLMSVSMFMSMLCFPLLLHLYQKRKQKRKAVAHKKDYDEYIKDMQKKIMMEIADETEFYHRVFPSIKEMWSKKLFWYRNRQDSFYMTVPMIMKSCKSDIIIHNESKENFSLLMQNVPQPLDLKRDYCIGVQGNKKMLKDYFLYLVLQLTLSHSYKDIRIAYMGDEDISEIRWLPHMQFQSLRTYFCSKSDAFDFLAQLHEKMKLKKPLFPPLIIFLWMDTDWLSEDLFHDVFTQSYQGITLIAFSERFHPYDRILIDVNQFTYCRWDTSEFQSFTYESVTNAKEIILFLANQKPMQQTTCQFPQSISFLSMYGIHFIEELHIWEHWEKHQSDRTLQVPIGIQKNGSLLFLDIHEKGHGPHGIIAGMTGSGKSECILTYLLSMAIHYHPDDVSFVIIDYKGGGLAKLLENLPHTCGVLTNLDESLLQRTFQALKNEVRKRQEILKAAASQFQIANITVNDYQKLYYEHKVTLPLSHLLIICDEFAELKMQQPIYLDQLISIARIGRSLGIHLILATQKPNGIINDQIWSNTNFHLCLKVADKADSVDMIKQPNASYLTASGLFYLQLGNEKALTLGLCAWTKAPYCPKDVSYPCDKIRLITNTGKIEHEISIHDILRNQQDTMTQLAGILYHLKRCGNQKNLRAIPLWKPPLTCSKTILSLTALYGTRTDALLIGEIDDPDKQCYRGLYFTLCHHAIIYGNADLELFLLNFIHSCEHIENLSITILDMHNSIMRLRDIAKPSVNFISGSEREQIRSFFETLKIQKSVEHTAQCYVMIYGIRSFEEMFPELQSEWMLLLHEGRKHNIYVIIFANCENDLRYSMRTYFSHRYILDMQTREEYVSLLNKSDFQLKEYQKGRGYIAEDAVYEFWLAKCDEEI